jgi:hypothetical protein
MNALHILAVKMATELAILLVNGGAINTNVFVPKVAIHGTENTILNQRTRRPAVKVSELIQELQKHDGNLPVEVVIETCHNEVVTANIYGMKLENMLDEDTNTRQETLLILPEGAYAD